MAEAELPITGYLDRFSRRPGETFIAYVSVRQGGSYRARLVRVLSGDPNPAGPGVRFEDLSHRFDQSFTGRRQPIHLGSYGVVGKAPVRNTNTACTWTVLVRPGLVDAGQSLLSEEAGDTGVALTIGANGATARITHRGATIQIATGTAMHTARWYRVWLAVDPAGEIPVLVEEDGTVISGAYAIVEYLEEVYPEITLLGMTPGILAMAVLGAQIADLARHASWLNILLLALAFLGWLAICAGAQFVATWLAGRR